MPVWRSGIQDGRYLRREGDSKGKGIGGGGEGEHDLSAESQLDESEIGCSWLLDQGKMLLSEIQDLEAEMITRQL